MKRKCISFLTVLVMLIVMIPMQSFAVSDVVQEITAEESAISTVEADGVTTPAALETPGDPALPETPGDPAVPETPGHPAVPETPDDPAVPETPGDPAAPETSGDGIVTVPTDDAIVTEIPELLPEMPLLTMELAETPTVIEIVAFDSITDLNAGTEINPIYANAAAVAAALPTTVTAITASGGSVSVSVSEWIDSDGYDPIEEGNYTFIADLGALPGGYANSGDYTATVEVVLQSVQLPEESYITLGGIVGGTANPLRFHVGSQGSMKAYVYVPDGGSAEPDDGDYQYQYYGEDCWGSTIYMIDADTDLFFGTPYYSGLTQYGEGNQTLVNGNTVKTEWLLYNGKIKITQTVFYIPGQDTVEKKWKIENLSEIDFTDLRYLHGGDAYFAGDDHSRSYYDESQGMVYLKNPDMSISGIMSYVGSESSPADHYFAGEYGLVRSYLTSSPPRLPDIANPSYVDSGYALEWDNATLEAGDSWTITSYERFSAQGFVQVIPPGNTTATAGAVVPLEFTVQNFLDATDTFNLSVSGVKGWDTNIRNASGEAISSVTVDGNGEAGEEIFVYVTVPGDAVNDYETITLKVVSTSDSAISGQGSATITVGEPEYGDAPGAPTGVTAVAGDGRAVVSFTPPEDEGGSEIIRYTVTASPGGITATGTESPITITGLTNGTAYTFTVVATNASGNSGSSTSSEPVTPEPEYGNVPGAPTGVTAVAGNGQAVISFTPPEDDGGSEIICYTVTASPGGVTVTGTTSPITVTGLTNGVAYTFTVVATNASGDSSSSISSEPVTPATAPHHHSSGGSSSPAPAPENILEFQIDVDNCDLTSGSAIKQIGMDVAPIIYEGRTLLPIRYVVEPLGGTVLWDPDEKKVTITLGKTTIEMWIGNNIAKVNGFGKQIDPLNPNVKPIIVEPGRTMLPLRFISEALGCTVDWDEKTKKITVTDWD